MSLLRSGALLVALLASLAGAGCQGASTDSAPSTSAPSTEVAPTEVAPVPGVGATAGPGLTLAVARLDMPPVDDLGFGLHPLSADHALAFEDDGVVYLDAEVLAAELGEPELTAYDGDGADRRSGRLYVSAEVVGREAGAFVWHRGTEPYTVEVFPRSVLPELLPDSDVGRAALAAGFEVFSGETPY